MPLLIDPERAAWVPGRRKFFLMGLAFALAPSLPKPKPFAFVIADLVRPSVMRPISVRFVEQYDTVMVGNDCIDMLIASETRG